MFLDGLLPDSVECEGIFTKWINQNMFEISSESFKSQINKFPFFEGIAPILMIVS